MRKDIERLEIEKNIKETQLRRVIREHYENKSVRELPTLINRNGREISVGDWIKATTPGNFRQNKEKVLDFKSWVTFVDDTGVKQVRAPKNLILCKNDGKCDARDMSSSS